MYSFSCFLIFLLKLLNNSLIKLIVVCLLNYTAKIKLYQKEASEYHDKRFDDYDKKEDNIGQVIKTEAVDIEGEQSKENDWKEEVNENREEMKTNRMKGKQGNKYNKNRKQKLSRKEIKCNICGETFESKAKMVIHKKVHKSEKPYSCDVCTKSFSLKEHY